MEFCGRCGHELGRGIERGRFCPRCGHEHAGNARYPLYADGTPAVTRPRPASVAQGPATATAPAVPPAPPPAPAPASAPAAADVTRRRMPAVVDPTATVVRARAVPDPTASQRTASASSWQITLGVTLTAMLLVVLLGLFLLMH